MDEPTGITTTPFIVTSSVTRPAKGSPALFATVDKIVSNFIFTAVPIGKARPAGSGAAACVSSGCCCGTAGSCASACAGLAADGFCCAEAAPMSASAVNNAILLSEFIGILLRLVTVRQGRKPYNTQRNPEPSWITV